MDLLGDNDDNMDKIEMIGDQPGNIPILFLFYLKFCLYSHLDHFYLYSLLFSYFFYRKTDASKRQIRQTPDWSENAVAGDHLWVPTSVSGDFCYVGDNECTVRIFVFFFSSEVRLTDVAMI